MEKDEKKISKITLIIYTLLFVALAAFALLKHLLFPAPINSMMIVSYACVFISLLLIVFIYAATGISSRLNTIKRSNRLIAISVCICASYAICIFAEQISIYLVPCFMTAFLLCPLAKRKDAFMANLFASIAIFLSLMIEYIIKGATGVEIFRLVVMFLTGLFGGSVASYCLTYERRRFDFILKGAAVCLASIVLIIALEWLNLFVLTHSTYNAMVINKADIIIKTLMWASIGIFSQLILSIFLQPILERAFNLLTNARLIDLTDHNFPLIRRLINEAPGTFNHSLTVANLAEVCATALGSNPYFARACAYYHDIGKLSNPRFFKENQPGENPHDTILPEVSAEIIRNHTLEGIQLCRQYNIPKEIADVAIEHHGTMPIWVFYSKAKKLTDGEVDIKEYSYSGPTPSSKAAAIIMICDSAEATIRSMETDDPDKIDSAVASLIWDRTKTGQFDRCRITLKELNIIKETIVNAFGGINHKRIQYTDIFNKKEPAQPKQ